MDSLGAARSGPGSQAGTRLFERKQAMLEEVADLEREIGRLASDYRADHPEVAARLDAAAATIRDDKLKERIRYSRGLIGVEDREYTNEFEAETTRIVEELQREIASASPPLVPTPLLLGMEQADAEILLDSLAFELAEIEYGVRFGRDRGRVVEQSPPPDSLVSPGSRVTLVVGR